ncbi:MAG: hypothetical protein V2I26_14690 [Halieaceae bacterium]|nr:hypothetical protein [Halieaceae bacterium]
MQSHGERLDRLAVIPGQPSALLPSLFEHVEEGQRLTVLHIGSATPETVAFFSRYRCKLHFIDLFGDLATLAPSEDATVYLPQTLLDLMQIPAGTRFDLCLFWDLFNFLERDAIAALAQVLAPHLRDTTLAHGFAVHSLKTPQSGKIYSIKDVDQIGTRPRPALLPGYKPCNQGQLERVLDCFSVTRSVLLPESRLELLLRARQQR